VQWIVGSLDTVRLLGGAAADTFDLNLDTLDGAVSRVVLDSADPTAGDRLDVVVTGSGSISQGAISTSGIVTDGADGQVIQFANLETINIDSTTDNSTLTVVATDDEDTIEVARVGAANEGRVWINDGTVITLNVGGGDNNFGGSVGTGGLIIEGRFGADRFTATPVAGVPITYRGGAPSDRDTATVNASADVEVSALTVDGAQVDVAGFASVILETVSSLAIRGDGGGDTLTATTPSGADNLVLTPGVVVDSGDLQVGSLIPLAFSNLGTTGDIVLADAGGSRVDRLTYQGTLAGDNFGLAAASGDITLNSQIVVATPGVTNVTLEGHGSNDHFTVDSPQPYTHVVLAGGDSPDNGDTVTLNATADTTVTLGGNVASFVGGGFSGSTLIVPGIQDVALNAGANTITVDGTANDDRFVVTPTAGNIATIYVNEHAPVLTTNNSGSLKINAGGGGQDTLDVVLSNASETVTVNSNFVRTVRGALTEAIDYTVANVDALRVFGAEGTDEFNVTVDSFTPSIFIDGGDPIGPGIAGDTLNFIATTAVAVRLGPQIDEGSFIAATSAPVSFDKIENPTVTTDDQEGATVSGTIGNDAIAVVARDASTHAGTNGNRDFTVALSGPWRRRAPFLKRLSTRRRRSIRV
jgi:hypothetical protein